MTGTGVTELFGALADLVLPVACAGCGAERVPLRFGACAACAAQLESLTPYATAPVPAPAGLPPCTTVGPYAGVLREALLAYKERERYRLAVPFGALLSGAVADAVGAGPVLLIPVPSTARAVRERHGDHVSRLAAHTVRRLRRAGWDAAVVRLLRAEPRPDSATLDSAGRAAVAQASLRLRTGPLGGFAPVRRAVREGARVVVVDDIVTTGATLSAVAGRLAAAGIAVDAAAVLAATQRRHPITAGTAVEVPKNTDWANPREPVVRRWGDSRASAR